MKPNRQSILTFAGMLTVMGTLTSQAMAGGVAGDNKITSDGKCEYSRDETHTWGGTNNCLPGTGNSPVGNVTFRQPAGGAGNTAVYSILRGGNAGSSAFGTVYCSNGRGYNFSVFPGYLIEGNCETTGATVVGTVCGSDPVCQGHALR